MTSRAALGDAVAAALKTAAKIARGGPVSGAPARCRAAEPSLRPICVTTVEYCERLAGWAAAAVVGLRWQLMKQTVVP